MFAVVSFDNDHFQIAAETKPLDGLTPPDSLTGNTRQQLQAALARALGAAGDLPMPEVKNPTELRIALSFGLLYALVLLASAWLQDIAGDKGLFIVALASGLTDADASVLSTLRLFNLETIPGHQAVIAVTLALMANLVFKIGLVVSIGGAKLARHALPGLLAIGGGMALGLLLV